MAPSASGAWCGRGSPRRAWCWPGTSHPPSPMTPTRHDRRRSSSPSRPRARAPPWSSSCIAASRSTAPSRRRPCRRAWARLVAGPASSPPTPRPPPCNIERMFVDAEAGEEQEAPWAARLNPDQARAVVHDGGPMLVVAGAGSGKTRTLASRVARLLAEGVDPDRVLLLTFSRRAAREMLRRAEHLGADRAAGRVWGGTFHAMASRILREHGRAVGLAPGLPIRGRG